MVYIIDIYKKIPKNREVALESSISGSFLDCTEPIVTIPDIQHLLISSLDDINNIG